MGGPYHRDSRQTSLRGTHTVLEFYWVLFRLMVAPFHPGYLHMARPLHVWYDPVPQRPLSMVTIYRVGHACKWGSWWTVGFGPPENRDLTNTQAFAGVWWQWVALMSLGRSLGVEELNRSSVMLSAVSAVPWKSGGLYLFLNWGWWWQIQQSVKLQPFCMSECYFKNKQIFREW